MPVIFKLVTALLLGAAIGLEREAYEKKIDRTPRSGRGSLGIRTYSLISLLGCIAGLGLETGMVPLFVFIAATFSALLVIYYIIGSVTTKDLGMTTEIAILLCFVFGAVIGTAFMPVQYVVAMTVVLILILSMKDEIRTFVAGVKEYELDAFISYAIIALVILPFLPDVSYRFSNIPGARAALGPLFNTLKNIELVNPFGLWKVVAIITGIEVAGYLLEKTIGQKGGWLLTSFAGGFISSTSTTQSLAIRSKKTKSANRLVSAAIVSNVSSFLQHFILIVSLNTVLLSRSVGYIAGLTIAGIIIMLYFMFRKEKAQGVRLEETKKRLGDDPIFSLKPALQFAVLFLVIRLVSKIALVLFGNNAFFVTVVFSALVGIDAITINISEIAGRLVSWQVAVIALMLANVVNLVAKSVYSFMLGSRSFAVRFTFSMLGVIAGGVIGLIVTL
jgi:uncharacterized membrane protein (DUF4010 family)